MSNNYTGVTFSDQTVTPSDDALVRQTLLTDGALMGCGLSYSGSTLTMAAGQLMVCGRQIVHPSTRNWAVTEQTSGYARLVITIDLTRTSTNETFDQVSDAIQYASAVSGFPALDQTEINGSGTKYQISVCVVSLGPGGITGIVSRIGPSTVRLGDDVFEIPGAMTVAGDLTAEGKIILTPGVNLFSDVSQLPGSAPENALFFVVEE